MKTQRLILLVAFYLLMLSVWVHAFLKGAIGLMEALLPLCLAIVVTRLCVIDSRIIGRPLVHAAQLTMIFTWPISAPIYLIWSRGAKGLLILAGLGASLLVIFVGIVVVAVVLRVGLGLPLR